MVGASTSLPVCTAAGSLSDPNWIARHWLPPDDPEETPR